MLGTRIVGSLCSGLIAWALPLFATAQCGPYKHHPIWPDTVGFAYVNLLECGTTVTSCEWDNGSTNTLTNLSTGSHSVTFFDGSIPLYTLNFQIDQVAWQLQPLIYGPQMGVIVETAIQLQHCPAQIFDNLSCPPAPDSTVLYLLQDGLIIDSITPIDCFGGTYSWNSLPFGHVYGTYLLDHSHCGSYMYSSSSQTYTCDSAEMELAIQDASGGTNGIIQVQEVLPDPFSLLPPPSPISGSFSLFEWPSLVLLSNVPSSTSAEWDSLAPGQYFVLFVPDSICAAVDTVINVDNITAIADGSSAHTAGMLAWPQPAETTLFWTAKPTARIRVYDAQGRSIREGPDRGELNVSDLPSGLYLLEVVVDEQRWRTRFLKQ